jgi:hypothetical protein
MRLPPAEPVRTPESSLGEAFSWPMRDPEWLPKILLMGLIALIPILGWLQLLGWMLAALDNLRAGHQYLPPAAFRYAGRGVWLFVASLIYGVAALVLFYGVLGLMVVAIIGVSPPSTGTGNASGTSAAFPLVMFPLMFGSVAVMGLVVLVLYLFVPLVILFTDRAGLGGAFNFVAFIRALRLSPKETFAAGAISLVAYLISGLGAYLCYVGLLFTIPYSLAVLAGALRWYEVKAKPGVLPE